MASRISDRVKRYPLMAYLVLAFGIGSICWFPTEKIASIRGFVLPRADSFVEFLQSGFVDIQHAIVSAIFVSGYFGPLFAAILVTVIEKGKSGLLELFDRIKKWRVGAEWYLAAVLLPLIINVSAVGVGVLLFGLDSSTLGPEVPLQYTIMFVPYALFTSGLEEPGWRGYALPKLQTRRNARKSSLLLGIIWGLWHLPFVVYLNFSRGIIPGVLRSLLYAYSFFPLAIIHTWLYNNTESVLISILFHAAEDSMNTYMLGDVTQPIMGTILRLINTAVAIILLKLYGSTHLARKLT